MLQLSEDFFGTADRTNWTGFYNFHNVEDFWSMFKADMGITELTVTCVVPQSNGKMSWITKSVRRERQLPAEPYSPLCPKSEI